MSGHVGAWVTTWLIIMTVDVIRPLHVSSRCQNLHHAVAPQTRQLNSANIQMSTRLPTTTRSNRGNHDKHYLIPPPPKNMLNVLIHETKSLPCLDFTSEPTLLIFSNQKWECSSPSLALSRHCLGLNWTNYKLSLGWANWPTLCLNILIEKILFLWKGKIHHSPAWGTGTEASQACSSCYLHIFKFLPPPCLPVRPAIYNQLIQSFFLESHIFVKPASLSFW